MASIAQLVEALDKMNATMVRVTPATRVRSQSESNFFLVKIDIGVVSLGKRLHTAFYVLSETDVNSEVPCKLCFVPS